jgi:hypothetical protein
MKGPQQESHPKLGPKHMSSMRPTGLVGIGFVDWHRHNAPGIEWFQPRGGCQSFFLFARATRLIAAMRAVPGTGVHAKAVLL